MNSNNKFSVCVIVPNFNDYNYLSDCLNSVLSQSIPFDQIIFIDDASTDESLAFAQKTLANRPEASVIFNIENKGTVLSINHALEHCTCDYVLFLSANDFISPYLVERFHATVQVEVGFWSALCQNVSDDGQRFFARKTPIIATAPRFFSAFQTLELIRIYTNWSPGTTLFYHRKQVMEHGGLSPSLGGLSDWLLAVILGVKSGVMFVPEVLGTVRLHANTYLGSTLQNESSIASTTENYLRDQIALITELKTMEIDMIVNKVLGRVKLNSIIGMILYSGSIRAKIFHCFQLGVLLLEFLLSRGFMRLMIAKYVRHMRIWNLF